MSLVGSRPIGKTALPRPPLPTVEGDEGPDDAEAAADGVGEAAAAEGLAPTVEVLGAGMGAVLARGVLIAPPPTIDILDGTTGAFFLGSASSEDEEGDEDAGEEVEMGEGSTSGEEETETARDPESEVEVGVEDPEEEVLGDFGGLAVFWVLGFFPTEVETAGEEVAIEEEAEEEVPKMAWRADSSKRWD